jgi:cyclophilin family peptidyl-prolyl cis-trans isomerase
VLDRIARNAAFGPISGSKDPRVSTVGEGRSRKPRQVRRNAAQTFRDSRAAIVPSALMRARTLLGGLVVALCACRPAPAGRGETDVKSRAGQDPSSTTRLLDIENRRVMAGVTDQDIANPDPAVRRLAARALARLGNAQAVTLLQKALSDEDGEVVSWAAHGLSYICRNEAVNGLDVARALATRAATLPIELRGSLDATFAITRGLGRCASEEAERTLVTWLGGPRPRAEYAALALGDVASRRKWLAEPSYAALLASAVPGDASESLGGALYPFGRLESAPKSFEGRLLAIAATLLRRPGAQRIFAIRALSRVGPAAASELGRVLINAETYTVVERAEAARGLARLPFGEAGQKALSQALPTLVPGRDPLAMTSLGTDAYGPLLVALEGLRAPPPKGAERTLYELAGLTLPKEAPAPLARRVVRLRCRAASLLVEGAFEDPLIVNCDPDPDGLIGQRALLDVIGRRPIEGRRLSAFRKLATSSHLRVKEGALELLAGHAEVEETPAMVARALGAKEVGVVATAAEFIAAHPERVSMRLPGAASEAVSDAAKALEPGAIHPEVATKLREALARPWAPDDVETLGTLVEAAGATRLDGVMSQLEAFCQSSNPTLREHAARALSLVKAPRVTCAAPPEATEGAPELGHLVTSPIKLELVTDAGPLTLRLDPTHAPVTVTRIADLAREGFYKGIVVHRVVPGFVVQFGDPGADGFGGPGRAPLRCETTPAPFGPLDVGVALAGRDTGSSQLFVTLARYPNLDQEYALIGKAEGEWNSVAEGDVIREVRVIP